MLRKKKGRKSKQIEGTKTGEETEKDGGTEVNRDGKVEKKERRIVREVRRSAGRTHGRN